jgi:hypothetical protein
MPKINLLVLFPTIFIRSKIVIKRIGTPIAKASLGSIGGRSLSTSAVCYIKNKNDTLIVPKSNKTYRLTNDERIFHYSHMPYSLKEILYGIMLSDGHIFNKPNSLFGTFRFTQTTRKLGNYNYFLYVAFLFKPYLTEDFVNNIKYDSDHKSASITL